MFLRRTTLSAFKESCAASWPPARPAAAGHSLKSALLEAALPNSLSSVDGKRDCSARESAGSPPPCPPPSHTLTKTQHGKRKGGGKKTERESLEQNRWLSDGKKNNNSIHKFLCRGVVCLRSVLSASQPARPPPQPDKVACRKHPAPSLLGMLNCLF